MSFDDLRQLAARRRLGRLLRFYDCAPCRMARLHVLTTAAVVLGEFCGHSRAFDAIGAALMPIDESGAPRTASWRTYARACARGWPTAVRDELWIRAHIEDMERVRAAGLVARFERESRANAHATWLLLRQHMHFTLGAKRAEGFVLEGALAEETAIAEDLVRSLGRVVRGGWALVAFYAWTVLRALVGLGARATGDAPSDRRAALALLASAFGSLACASVYRRGVQARERGHARRGDGWPLIAQVLGPGVRAIDPLVVRFYRDPGRFETTASLDLHATSARVGSWVATLLTGQGLHEGDGTTFDARFRTFRREDGSMHFVRELYCGGTLRTFDSDFVVAERDGRPTLHEVFSDLGISIAMKVTALEGGALSIRGREVRLHGVRLPMLGLDVEFVSRRAGRALEIDGHLRFGARELGCIHYRARERAEVSSFAVPAAASA